ncbi:MAG: CesT family type III secretion system chaperone [Myxococcales bacterium]|nr:CesT family type III secretion system chaperone [Myxococcales bacterium]
MVTNDNIESYMLNMGLVYDTVSDGMWVIHDDTVSNIVVKRADSVLLFRVKMMELPDVSSPALFEKLLRLNATEMIHGSYGVEDGSVVITAALEVENLDYNEFQAAIDSITMALSTHYPVLKDFRN